MEVCRARLHVAVQSKLSNESTHTRQRCGNDVGTEYRYYEVVTVSNGPKMGMVVEWKDRGRATKCSDLWVFCCY
jgi:hypothetical protein